MTRTVSYGSGAWVGQRDGATRWQLPRRAGGWWLELSLDGHSIERGFTQVGAGAGQAQQGALFIDHQATLTTMADGTGPKLLVSTGHDRFPRGTR